MHHQGPWLYIVIDATSIHDEKREYMETVSYMLTSWHDGRLMWNMSQYAGIDTVKIPANELWTPDLVPYTSTDQLSKLYTSTAELFKLYPSTVRLFKLYPTVHWSVLYWQ
ncbi:Neuronal acetylcholine receptor subunit alpha-7 [Bulinus truncatus]|nr:Neuronal acetylcholine receptor subunit alpha-7 [Bulinus truncatus]